MSTKGLKGPPLIGYARSSRKQKMVLDADLNTTLNESLEGSSAHANFVAAKPDEQVGSVQHVPIDVDAFDDDVLISSPMAFAKAKNNSRRNRERPVIIDVDSEEWMCRVDPNTHDKRRRVPSNQTIRGCDIYVSLEGPSNMKGENVQRSEPPPTPPPSPPLAKEPAFSCPVCMGQIVEEMSTKCGHIFCKSCIKAAVAAQGKCPTCRTKVTMRNTIRVYLPTTK